MKLAAIQLNSSNNKANNLKKVRAMVQAAAAQGAEFISLPEVFNFRGNKEESINNAEDITGNSIVELQGLAQDLKVWILCGSFFERSDGDKLPYNSSILINPKAGLEACYRKIHLFDVEIEKKSIRESDKTRPGSLPVIAKIGDIKLGMSICYDLRFPELYRFYAREKVELISVPSAFTSTTGKAHWHCLLRARAIENQAYVIAANQCGKAADVESYGHSLIVDPWGTIIAEASYDNEEIIFGKMDLNYLYNLRREMPVLEHRMNLL